METELFGDCLSRGTNQLGTHCGGPNVSLPPAYCIKVRYSEKATKIRNNLPFPLILITYSSNIDGMVASKKLGDLFSYFCGILRISELYHETFKFLPKFLKIK